MNGNGEMPQAKAWINIVLTPDGKILSRQQVPDLATFLMMIETTKLQVARILQEQMEKPQLQGPPVGLDGNRLRA